MPPTSHTHRGQAVDPEAPVPTLRSEAPRILILVYQRVDFLLTLVHQLDVISEMGTSC
jgi:hypothetical protein